MRKIVPRKSTKATTSSTNLETILETTSFHSASSKNKSAKTRSKIVKPNQERYKLEHKQEKRK